MGAEPSIAHDRPPAARAAHARLVFRATLQAAFVLAVAVLVASQFAHTYARDREGIDFRWTIWQPARDVLHGRNPYGDPHAAGFLAESVYPPLTFVALAPLSLVHFAAALAIWQLLLFAVAAAIPAVLGVRDWRCYAVWLSSMPVAADVLFGNATLVVVLLVALCWRWRDRWQLAATTLSLAVVVKLLVAPLCLWLLFTRRWRAAAATAVLVPVGLLLPWLAIGLDGLADYPALLRSLSESHGGNGIFAQALARQSGLGVDAALAVGLLAAACCAVAAFVARRDEVSCLAFASAAALLATPVAWIYYPALFVVPLAARFPRFNLVWLAFAALWVSWYRTPLGWATAGLSIAVLAVCGLMLVAIVVPGLRQRRTTLVPRPAT